jgi:hypothetical protein
MSGEDRFNEMPSSIRGKVAAVDAELQLNGGADAPDVRDCDRVTILCDQDLGRVPFRDHLIEWALIYNGHRISPIRFDSPAASSLR